MPAPEGPQEPAEDRRASARLLVAARRLCARLLPSQPSLHKGASLLLQSLKSGWLEKWSGLCQLLAPSCPICLTPSEIRLGQGQHYGGGQQPRKRWCKVGAYDLQLRLTEGSLPLKMPWSARHHRERPLSFLPFRASPLPHTVSVCPHKLSLSCMERGL